MHMGMIHLLLLHVWLCGLGAAESPAAHLNDIYHFPNGTWLENIAIRTNGNVLVTAYNKAQLWEIDPFCKNNSKCGHLLHQFDHPGTITGITELQKDDVFAVIASNSLWRVDTSGPQSLVNPIDISIPAGNLNGIATLDEAGQILAVSDSLLGLIWRVDLARGNYSILLRDNTTATSTATGTRSGVNGVRVLGNLLYYVNTPQRTFYGVHLNPDHEVSDQPSTIFQGALADDFAITHNAAFLAGLRDNVITEVLFDGRARIVAGNATSRSVMTATSAAFGRTPWDKNILYITTGGETQHPVNSTGNFGGKVVALEIRA